MNRRPLRRPARFQAVQIIENRTTPSARVVLNGKVGCQPLKGSLNDFERSIVLAAGSKFTVGFFRWVREVFMNDDPGRNAGTRHAAPCFFADSIVPKTPGFLPEGSGPVFFHFEPFFVGDLDSQPARFVKRQQRELGV